MFFKPPNQKIIPQLKFSIINKNHFRDETIGGVILPLNNFPFFRTKAELRKRNSLIRAKTYDAFLQQAEPPQGREGYIPVFNKTGQISGELLLEI